MKIVAHQKFKDYQEKYGAIPASDKNNHLTKSRMLQGVYQSFFDIFRSHLCL